MQDFQIPNSSLTDLSCDNTSVIALANNPIFHAITKHIEIDHHFICDHIQSQTIIISPVTTEDQIADILTKPLSTLHFHLLRNKLIVQPDPLACGGIITNI